MVIFGSLYLYEKYDYRTQTNATIIKRKCDIGLKFDKNIQLWYLCNITVEYKINTNFLINSSFYAESVSIPEIYQEIKNIYYSNKNVQNIYADYDKTKDAEWAQIFLGCGIVLILAGLLLVSIELFFYKNDKQICGATPS
jgi:hypothetical protein